MSHKYLNLVDPVQRYKQKDSDSQKIDTLYVLWDNEQEPYFCMYLAKDFLSVLFQETFLPYDSRDETIIRVECANYFNLLFSKYVKCK